VDAPYQDMVLWKWICLIVIHASTQANNRDPKHVKFLKDAEMQRVVLARELNLDQIRYCCRNRCGVNFSFLGALCVSLAEIAI
jgi:putative protease